MSDPYRSAAGTPCPRCALPLAEPRPGELGCVNGCGSWIGNARLVQLVDPARIAPSSSAPFFHATPLPPTPCPVCRARLNDLYQGNRQVLTIGQCLAHGIWIQNADLAAFTAAFADLIEVHREALAREQTLAAADPLVASLVLRVETLEARVAELERALTQLTRA